MKITIRGLYGQYGENPVFEETIDADTADIQALAESYAQQWSEQATMLEFEAPDEPDESKRFFRFGIWWKESGIAVSPLDENQYIGTPEDLDALGIPRSHTVISSGRPSKLSPKPETKE